MARLGLEDDIYGNLLHGWANRPAYTPWWGSGNTMGSVPTTYSYDYSGGRPGTLVEDIIKGAMAGGGQAAPYRPTIQRPPPKPAGPPPGYTPTRPTIQRGATTEDVRFTPPGPSIPGSGGRPVSGTGGYSTGTEDVFTPPGMSVGPAGPRPGSQAISGPFGATVPPRPDAGLGYPMAPTSAQVAANPAAYAGTSWGAALQPSSPGNMAQAMRQQAGDQWPSSPFPRPAGGYAPDQGGHPTYYGDLTTGSVAVPGTNTQVPSYLLNGRFYGFQRPPFAEFFGPSRPPNAVNTQAYYDWMNSLNAGY